jgi:hypothetical protein
MLNPVGDAGFAGLFIPAAYPVPNPITDYRGGVNWLEQYLQTISQFIIYDFSFVILILWIYGF